MSQPSDAPSQVTPQTFKAQLASLTSQLADRPLDGALDDWLNTYHGAGSRTYLDLEAACRAGAAAGWLCDREGDGRSAGWRVCPPGSAHRPTVSQGRALVLYLLPEGQIQFTR